MSAIYQKWKVKALECGRPAAAFLSRRAPKPKGFLFELRIDGGPGYRVYYAMIGRECVLLLCGGDKRKQAAVIERALEYLRDYKERSGTS